MALNQGAKMMESAIGHDDKDRAVTTDVSNPEREGGKYADPSGEKMLALAWMGKNDVRVGMSLQSLIMHTPSRPLYGHS